MPSYVLKKRKNYYKRVWEDWTQPVLTANGTMGGDSFAVNQSSAYASNRQAWVAFDGVDNTGVDWNSAQGVPQWISWYNPVPLSISKITIVNTPETAYPDTIKDYEVQVSDDNAVWKTIYSGTNTTGAGETWDIDLSNVENSSKYWRIYITSCNNRNYARIVELKITAKTQRIIQVNLGGEDVWEDFKQPVLKADGVIGGDKFAVTEVGSWNDGHPAYYAFNDDSSDTHSVFTKSSGYFIFYNPRDLIVTKLTIRNATGDGWGTRAWMAGTVNGSNDGVNFEEVTAFTNSVTGGNAYWDIDMSANTKGYRYYKIIVTSTSYANSGAASQCTARNIQITAKELTKVGGSDYDFMGDNQSYILKRKINKYYKDTVTTKYWKEITTTATVVEFACYKLGPVHIYAAAPIGSSLTAYERDFNGTKATDKSQLQNYGSYSSVSEDTVVWAGYTYTRSYADDLTTIATVTEVVEGTPDDYTYTTTETESVEVSANDDYDRVVVDSEPAYLLKTIKYRDVLNVSKVGSFAKIDKGIAGGFSAGNYLSLPETFTIGASDSFEIVVSFVHKTQSSVGYILGASTDATLGIIVNSNNTLKVNAGNGSSWYGDIFGPTVLTSGVKYWVKLVRDTSGWYLYLSTDGKEYNLEKNNTWSGAPRSTNIYIGNVYGNTPFLGQSIDLTQSYININGERWWSGDSYTKVGSWIDYDKVVASGFSASNYLTLPELFRPENNPWERVICFTTGSDVANAQMLNYINYASEQVAGAYIQIYQSRMNMQLSSNGSSWNISSDTGAITTLLPNTSYYAKLRFTGSEYQMLLSTTGEFKGEETLETTIASSTPIYQSNTGTDRLGYRIGSQPFTGSIDLSKCYGNINGERWWSGVKTEKY